MEDRKSVICKLIGPHLVLFQDELNRTKKLKKWKAKNASPYPKGELQRTDVSSDEEGLDVVLFPFGFFKDFQ